MTDRVFEIREIEARLDALPRVQLAHLPTPIDECPRAASEIGLERLLIKRDDCTGLAFGGNKARHHEFILGDALANGYDAVIQGAASQSNHSRQLAAAGAKIGLEVHLLPKLDARSSPPQGNFLITNLFGATMHPIGADDSSIQSKERLADELRARGRNPYLIGMGADRSLALAAVAYVAAFIEIVEELGANSVPPTIFCSSQGSTQAGLLVGARLLGIDTSVVGINPLDARHEAYLGAENVRAIAVQAARMLDVRLDMPLEDVVNFDAYVGDGYGIPTADGLSAIELLGRTEGVLLDPVYTSKAFAGLIDQCRADDLHEALFVHTGGLPALFAYAADVAP